LSQVVTYIEPKYLNYLQSQVLDRRHWY